MKILRATHLGMCFGVRDAIALAMEHSENEKVTILGELVHNETVNQSLREKGVEIRHHIEEATTSTVMITAHGASERAITDVKNRGHRVIEATCPLVHFAHQAVRKLTREGYHSIIIGKRDHVEVRGLTGDLNDYDVVLSEKDIMNLKEHSRFGVASQTTQPIDKVRTLVSLIQRRFPKSEVKFIDTVCQPTKQRQSAAIELARQCDVVVVIGGPHSNNTRELAATCRRFCERVVQIQDASELKPFWFYNAQTVGITAGTSTPDEVIDEVEQGIFRDSKLNVWTQESQPPIIVTHED